MTGLLLDLVSKYMRRYYMRNDRIIYAHMLEHKVDTAIEYNQRKYWNNYMAIGELIHIGASLLLEPCEQLCMTLYIPCSHMHPKARGLVLWHDGRKACVVLCGTPDGMHNGCPVEIKTTRNFKHTREPAVNWVLRARLYATLARARFAYLVVLDLYSATESVFECPRISWRLLKAIVSDWLKGVNILDKYRSLLYRGVRRVYQR